MTATTTTPTLPALATATAILQRLRGVRFAIAYGSHARGMASTRSDLDLLYVFDDRPDLMAIRYLVARVHRLHASHDLDLDHEVAYEHKLWTTPEGLRAAFHFAGFPTAPNGLPRVTAASTDPTYLNSPAFKARLLLNALTSPHVFLGGDRLAHSRAARAAAAALPRLALAAAGGGPVYGLHRLTAALITDPDTGATGQDWLGYQASDGPHLYALLAAAQIPGRTNDAFHRRKARQQ